MLRNIAVALMASGLLLLQAEALRAQKTTVGKQVSASDVMFVHQAGASGTAEVQLGKLAMDRAASEEVKEFGKRMVADHTKAGQELAKLAKAKGIDPPEKPGARPKQVIERLSKLSGAEFDRAYMEQMVEDHVKAVDLFKRQAENGEDKELKEFASKTLPILQEHLRMARELAQSIGAKPKQPS